MRSPRAPQPTASDDTAPGSGSGGSGASSSGNSSSSGDAGRADGAPASWAEHLRCFNAQRDRATFNPIVMVLLLVGLAPHMRQFSAFDAAVTALAAASNACMDAWQRRGYASWQRWREPTEALARVAVAGPAAWVQMRCLLSGTAQYRGHAALDAAAAVVTLLIISLGAGGGVLALVRPLSLALHLPTQAALFALVYSRNADMCALPALRHPAARRATAATYITLSALSGVAAHEHGTLGQCRTLLTLNELLLGLLAPTLSLAATEAAAFHRWRAHWLRWQHSREAAAAATAEGSSSSSAAAAAGASPEQRWRTLLDPAAFPFLRPPCRLWQRPYDVSLACRAALQAGEAADLAVAALTALLLLASAWRAIVALTPAP